MKIELGFLRSKVARRFFFIFLLYAVIPIIILAVLSFSQVSNQLKSQSQDRLHQSCKALGSAIYERLLIIETDLELMGVNLEPNEFSHPALTYDLTRLKDKFFGIYLLNKDKTYTLYGSEEKLLNLTSDETEFIKQEGKPVLFSRPLNGSSRICMAIKADNKNFSEMLIVSDINPLYLWYLSYEDVLPPETEFCVLDSEDHFLFTTLDSVDRFPSSSVFKGENPASGQFTWKSAEENYIASYRELFLMGRFSSPIWTIVLSELKSHVYAPMSLFKRTFPFMTLLSFWIVLLLSFIQIRKSLVPLEKIKDGAEKIMKKDFSTRVIIKSKDEFQGVADTFNAMADRLGRLFNSVSAASEIQRAILSSLKVDEIVERLLKGVTNIRFCDCVSVTLIDTKQDFTAKTFICNENNDLKKTMIHTHKIDTGELERIQEKEDSYFVECNHGSAPGYLLPLVKEGMRFFYVYPVFLKSALRGNVILGYFKRPVLDDIDTGQVKQLSELMGVALSNAELLKELEDFNLGTLRSLARAIDTKSSWTAGHSERGTEIALNIGKILNLSEVELDILKRGGLLHDIGKLGISNEILDKKEYLSKDEKEIMRTHPELGARILEPIAAYTDIIQIVHQHHENYDGSGYPNGLEKENISFYSRIFSVADCFESLTSDRPYRRAKDIRTAVGIIKSQAGKQFDPIVVEAFLDSLRSEEYEEQK